MGEDVADGGRGVRELAEATHLTEHELETTPWRNSDVILALFVVW